MFERGYVTNSVASHQAKHTFCCFCIGSLLFVNLMSNRCGKREGAVEGHDFPMFTHLIKSCFDARANV